MDPQEVRLEKQFQSFKFILMCRTMLRNSCDNLDEQKESLYDRKGNFNSRVAVKVAHVVGDLEDVHEQTEKAKQQ